MNKVAVITGGSSGIGKATAIELKKRGLTVYELSRRDSDIPGIIHIKADVTDGKSVSDAIDRVISEQGRIDILINNAGVSQQKLFTDIADDDWQQMVAVDLSAPFYMTRGLLPGMISRKYGRIINISSMWGVCGASCEVHYSAVKAGIIGMTKALAAEVAPSGITVNAIAPGVIETDMYRMLGQETMELVLDDIPAGRIGQPEDIARAALFLADPAASYITGQVLGINGGMVI